MQANACLSIRSTGSGDARGPGPAEVLQVFQDEGIAPNMRSRNPTALSAAILTALCLLLSTCNRLPAPGPAGVQAAAAER
jgi:hypothetical protein